jgi:MinD-like ATPase involved in chromosome partitioning or flagellar assembly
MTAALATALRGAGFGSTCLVDLDLGVRDVAKRFSVRGPSLGELARTLCDARPDDVLDLLGHDPATDIWVVPASLSASTVGVDALVDVVATLRERVDWLVIDAPPGFGTASRPVDRIAECVDVLLLATSVDPIELSAAATSMRTIARRQTEGSLPRGLLAQLVVSAETNELEAHRLTLQRVLRGLNDVVMLPRLWGRDALSPLGGEGVSEPFADLLARVSRRDLPQPV